MAPILLLFRFKDEMAEVSKKKKKEKATSWGKKTTILGWNDKISPKMKNFTGVSL